MKNKILFGLSLFTIVVVLVFNVVIATNGNDSGLSLNSLGICFQAQAENGTPGTECNGIQCSDVNGHFYKTDTKPDESRICCGIATDTDRGCLTSN